MISFTGLKSQFKTLSLNSSAANDTLAGLLLNQQHKLLLLKYFDNERAFTMTSIGPQSLAFTVTSGTTGVLTGGTTAILTSVWPTTSPTVQQLVVFSDGEQRNATFTQGSTTVTWQSPLTTSAGTSCAAVGVQSYPLPANISKIKNPTITIGQLVYTPAPIQSIQEWTKINALPYTSSIPAYFYVYNNQLNFWPIPAATGELMTLYCQISVADMTYEDNTTGTIAAAGLVPGSNAVTGNATNFAGSIPIGTDLTFTNLFFTAAPPQGDGLSYQIQMVNSGTSVTLLKPVVNVPKTAGGGTLLIGQYPLLNPDFHDTIIYGALRTYFMSIVKDTERYELYDGLYKERLELMKFYLATKQVNVDLGTNEIPRNPNLYFSGTQ
jgi:hypothetical protein